MIVMTVGYGISHKVTKHREKCNNNETTQKQYEKITDKYFFNILKR
jgi:hypothetical protein